MSCPVLSDVSAAEFEARIKVELSARATRGGELDVVCDNLAARLRWRSRGGDWYSRSLPAAAMPATLVDTLLVASKELVEEAARLDAANGKPAAESAKGSDPAPSSADDVAGSAEGVGTADRAREASRTQAGDAARAATGSEAAPSTDRSGTASDAPLEWAWGVSAGTQAAVFSLRGTGAVGPSIGTFVSLPFGIAVHLTGAYDFAFGAGDVVSVRVPTAALAIAARFGSARAFEVGAGGFIGSIFASAAPPYQPTSLTEAFGGAVVRGRYALGKDPWRFAVGPDLRVHGFRPEVAIDGATVWGVPVLSVGLALEVSRELYGKR